MCLCSLYCLIIINERNSSFPGLNLDLVVILTIQQLIPGFQCEVQFKQQTVLKAKRRCLPVSIT